MSVDEKNSYRGRTSLFGKIPTVLPQKYQLRDVSSIRFFSAQTLKITFSVAKADKPEKKQNRTQQLKLQKKTQKEKEKSIQSEHSKKNRLQMNLRSLNCCLWIDLLSFL